MLATVQTNREPLLRHTPLGAIYLSRCDVAKRSLFASAWKALKKVCS